MLIEPTLQKLHALRLSEMASAWQDSLRNPNAAQLSFDERFALLVDAEYASRDQRRLNRLLKDAQLSLPGACLEDFQATPERGFNASLLMQLSQGPWINEHQNVLICGATGVGKSYLACALGQRACRRGLRVLYRRVPRLFEELSLARAEGNYRRVLLRFAKHEVLVLDDFGIGTLRDSERQDLLELLEDRYGKRSTVITSQLPLTHWHQWIGDPTLADAILDRLVHNAYKVTLKGHSRRKTAPNNPTEVNNIEI